MYFARYSDAILGGILIAISGFLLVWLIPVGVQLPKSNKVLALSPDFWMKIIVWAMLLLGVYILLKGIANIREGLSEDEVSEVEAELAHRHRWHRGLLGAVAAVVGLFAYYFLIQWVGIVVSSIVAMLGFTLLCGERRLQFAIPLALALPVALYYFFLKIASIPMPLGIFG